MGRGVTAMGDTKIVEMIPDNMPDWAIEAMAEGQLFNQTFDRIAQLEAAQPAEARIDKISDPRYHPELPLLAKERTGWRRYVYGRWVYSSEPFRADIARRIAALQPTEGGE